MEKAELRRSISTYTYSCQQASPSHLSAVPGTKHHGLPPFPANVPEGHKTRKIYKS